MGMFPVYNLISTHYIGDSGTGARFRKFPARKKKEKEEPAPVLQSSAPF